jgi:sialate O-acetylesterase
MKNDATGSTVVARTIRTFARAGILLVALALAHGVGAAAEQSPLAAAAPIRDHMILQQGVKAPIWGTGAPGEKVVVTFRGQTKSAVADGKGAWRAELDPLKAEAGQTGEVLVISGDNRTLQIRDVLVGEVWFCGGQSNMAIPKGEWGGLLTREMPAEVRCFGGGDGNNPKGVATWYNAHVPGGHDGLVVSSLGLQFALALHTELKVPVGILVAARGASSAMIGRMSRMYGSFAVRGVFFDQGESGSGLPQTADGKDPWPQAMRILIKEWREQFGQTDLPVLYVQKPSGGGCESDWDERVKTEGLGHGGKLLDLPAQVPPYWNPSWTVWGEGDPDVQEYMTRDLLNDPRVQVAPSIDIGADLHPVNKVGYGRRAARVALATVYGRKDLEYSGPRLAKHTFAGGKATLTFTHVGTGLRAGYVNEVRGFAVCGKDRVFKWAQAKIVGKDTVQVWNETIPELVSVRYAWALDRRWANLFSGGGLPAFSFRTDRWHTRARLWCDTPDKKNGDTITIQPKAAVTLHWETQDGNRLSLQPFTEPVEAKGTREVKPQETTSYVLFVEGPVSSTVFVRVPKRLEAAQAAGAKPGVLLAVYPHVPRVVPGEKAKPLDLRAIPKPDSGSAKLVTRPEGSTAVLTGCLSVPVTGRYRFLMEIPGGSARLELDGTCVADAGMGEGEMDLEAGSHRWRLVVWLPGGCRGWFRFLRVQGPKGTWEGGWIPDGAWSH